MSLTYKDQGRLAFYLNKDHLTARHDLVDPTDEELGEWDQGWGTAEEEYQMVNEDCQADPRKRHAWGYQMKSRLKE